MPTKKAILILEDETTLAKAIKIMLEKEGFEVSVVGDGRVAIDTINSTDFDLVMLDLVTPGVDGFEVLKMIRTKDIRVPVFILSNLNEDQHKRKAMEIGADKYFVKSETLLTDIARDIKESFKNAFSHSDDGTAEKSKKPEIPKE